VLDAKWPEAPRADSPAGNVNVPERSREPRVSSLCGQTYATSRTPQVQARHGEAADRVTLPFYSYDLDNFKF
jgi:hypothetical protein